MSNSWIKTITVKYKNVNYTVLLYLSDTVFVSVSDAPQDERQQVTIRSMANELYLEQRILFEDRDAAYEFIENATDNFARAWFTRRANAEGAFD